MGPKPGQLFSLLSGPELFIPVRGLMAGGQESTSYSECDASDEKATGRERGNEGNRAQRGRAAHSYTESGVQQSWLFKQAACQPALRGGRARRWIPPPAGLCGSRGREGLRGSAEPAVPAGAPAPPPGCRRWPQLPHPCVPLAGAARAAHALHRLASAWLTAAGSCQLREMAAVLMRSKVARTRSRRPSRSTTAQASGPAAHVLRTTRNASSRSCCRAACSCSASPGASCSINCSSCRIVSATPCRLRCQSP